LMLYSNSSTDWLPTTDSESKRLTDWPSLYIKLLQQPCLKTAYKYYCQPIDNQKHEVTSEIFVAYPIATQYAFGYIRPGARPYTVYRIQTLYHTLLTLLLHTSLVKKQNFHVLPNMIKKYIQISISNHAETNCNETEPKLLRRAAKARVITNAWFGQFP